MPSTKGLEVLVRKNSLTDDEWLSLIEARRELIKPHLDSFTLAELGSFPCLTSESVHYHEIKLDNPIVVGEEPFSLKTQGIFDMQPWQAVERIPNPDYKRFHAGARCLSGTLLLWGLTRSGLWVLVTVRFVGENGYKDRGNERAESVEIIETDLPTIIAKTKSNPQDMWKKLGRAVKESAEKRENLYKMARNLARMVNVEELALQTILK